MRYLYLLLNFGSFIGFILMILGFLLIPFFIGIPIMLAGILLLVYNIHKSLADTFVPEKTKEKISGEIAKACQPYQPAIAEIRNVGKDMLKVAGIVFIILLAVLAIIFFRDTLLTSLKKCF